MGEREYSIVGTDIFALAAEQQRQKHRMQSGSSEGQDNLFNFSVGPILH